MATSPPSDLNLRDLSGNEFSLQEWVLLFNMLAVVIDPYTNESGWILKTSDRLFNHYDQADLRVAFIATCDDAGAKAFLGPLAEKYQVFLDPDRTFVTACEFEMLPALVHFRQDASLHGVAEGWQPAAWTEVLDGLESDLAWRSKPLLPAAGDPRPYSGTPAAG